MTYASMMAQLASLNTEQRETLRGRARLKYDERSPKGVLLLGKRFGLPAEVQNQIYRLAQAAEFNPLATAIQSAFRRLRSMLARFRELEPYVQRFRSHTDDRLGVNEFELPPGRLRHHKTIELSRYWNYLMHSRVPKRSLMMDTDVPAGSASLPLRLQRYEEYEESRMRSAGPSYRTLTF